MKKIIYIAFLLALMASCTKGELMLPIGNSVTPGVMVAPVDITDPDKDDDHDGEGITDPDKDDDHDKDGKNNQNSLR